MGGEHADEPVATGPDAAEEVLHLGSDGPLARLLRGRRYLRLAWVPATALAVAGYLVIGAGRHPASPPPARASVDPALTMVAQLARRSAPLDVYVRSSSPRDSCRLVRPAAHPLPHVAAAIHRSLPGYAVQDSGRVLDQFTALCTVTVRAQDAAGTTLVVYVVGPDGNPAKTGRSRWQTVVRVDGAMITRSTTLFRGGGWMVRVGTVGPVADQPTTAKLRRVAQDPDLLW